MTEHPPVQGEVARDIAESISLHLTPQERSQLSVRKAVDPEVAMLIFKGQYLLRALDTERAKAMFSQATRTRSRQCRSLGRVGGYPAYRRESRRLLCLSKSEDCRSPGAEDRPRTNRKP